MRRVRDAFFRVGEVSKSIILDDHATSAPPSDKFSIKIRTLEWRRSVASAMAREF